MGLKEILQKAAVKILERSLQVDLPNQTVKRPRAWSFSPGAAAEPRQEPNVAVLVVHGMGQQLRFETLDQVVVGLHRAEGHANKIPIQEQKGADVRIVRLGDEELAQAEMILGRKSRCTHVHLYEGYWAPLMEGNVNLRDILSFLVGGGVNGLRNSFRRFRRRMFGREVELEIVWRTPLFLLLALMTILSLIIVNATSAFVFGSIMSSRLTSEWVSDVFLLDVTSILLSLLGLLFVWILGMLLLKRMLFLWLALLTVIGAGASFLWMVWAHRLTDQSVWPFPFSLGDYDRYIMVVAWLLILAASIYVRRLLVEYVGDVVAYVSPHKLDRFFELRRRVKERVLSTARAIYRARSSDGHFLYDRIAVVAHSLGSVVAYDALNTLINEDLMSTGEERSNVRERTALFLTFGSPLDKTAFVFRAQTFHTNETVQNLALAGEPLLQDYENRQFHWANIWSKKDIISGPLDFYDDPKNSLYLQRRVRNEEDRQADVPVYAHVQYWKNPMVFRKLHTAILYAKSRPQQRPMPKLMREAPEKSQGTPKARESQKLDSLGLDEGTLRVLKNAGIATRRELEAMTPDEIEDLKGVGPVRLQRIGKALSRRE